MQTFLPYTSFHRSVAVLDNRRLCKQIVEAWQIYTGRVPQANHPACLMWANARPALARYIFNACEEYAVRFGKDHSILAQLLDHPAPARGRHEFIASNLLRLSHCVNLARKGVSSDEMLEEAEKILGKKLPLEAYPGGYYWPIDTVGMKGTRDKIGWMFFWKKHGTPPIRYETP